MKEAQEKGKKWIPLRNNSERCEELTDGRTPQYDNTHTEKGLNIFYRIYIGKN